MRVQLRGAAPGLYKLFTLHPVCDIIAKTRASAPDTHIHTTHACAHACTHTAPSTLCRLRIRGCQFSTRYTLNRIARAGNTVGGGKARRTHTPPEGGENSLKIPNVYSYNLHVIISDTSAGRPARCIVRVLLCTPPYM